MDWMMLAVVVLVGYLLGNLNGAILISRLLLKEDVRTKGSGNAGLTNFHRNYGGLKTFLVLGIDVVKTVAAALIGGWLLGPAYGMVVGGVAAVLGHMFPICFGFRGGKGVLSAGTLAATLDWRVFLIIIGVFLVTTILSKFVSLGSILAAVGFGICFAVVYQGNPVATCLTVGVALLVIFMHRGNIVRLMKGQENKLKLKK